MITGLIYLPMKERASNKFILNGDEPLIEFQGVDIVNDTNLVLSNISFTVDSGEFIYLVGKVGSGKSSIIKTIIAELPLTSGFARVGEYDLGRIKRKQIPFLRRKIGVVFQDFQLLMDRSVERNLLFVLEATGWKNGGEMNDKVAQVLEMVGMETKAHKMPHQLSGGEQQRIVIARALLNDPQLILADEPTGNFDPDTAIEIMDLFTKIHREQKPALIMVTHNRELVKRYPARTMICENETLSEMDMEIEVNFSEIF